MEPAFETLAERAEPLGVDLSPAQISRLSHHFRGLLEENRRTNLTRVTDPEEAVTTLYLASFAVVPALVEIGVVLEGIDRYLDLGTGAGFPGVPLSVAWPHMETLLVDARRKKVDFLRGILETLSLPSVRAVHSRGAELTRNGHAEEASFALVTSRAVGTAAESLREVRDLVAPGGMVAVQKGPNLRREEVKEAERAASKYGFVSLGVVPLEIEDLRPRVLLYRRWSAFDENEGAR